MKRDRLEIIQGILIICKNGAKKTEIVYKANLNFKNAEVYLQWLIDRDLITKEEKSFKTTPKGARLLSDLQNASSLMDLKDRFAVQLSISSDIPLSLDHYLDIEPSSSFKMD